MQLLRRLLDGRNPCDRSARSILLRRQPGFQFGRNPSAISIDDGRMVPEVGVGAQAYSLERTNRYGTAISESSSLWQPGVRSPFGNIVPGSPPGRKQVDVLHHEKPSRRYAGSLEGIYEIRNNSPTVCDHLTGSRYPNSFDSVRSSRRVLYQFRWESAPGWFYAESPNS
jgi:hypothetical protein